METKTIEISRENALKAYNDASDEGKKLLENLFGNELFTPKDITERIKTFEDACKELNRRAEDGDETASLLLADYESNADNIKMPETLAYMKACIIVRALNEGWEPKFVNGEYRYYPWFYLYTQEEIDRMDEEDRSKLLSVGGGAHYGSRCGLSSARSHNAFSYSHASFGARLAFKTSELAEYAGRQFIEIWSDLVFRAKNEEAEK